MSYFRKLLKTYMVIAFAFIIIIFLIFSLGYGSFRKKEQEMTNQLIFNQACMYTNQILSSIDHTLDILCTSSLAADYANGLSNNSKAGGDKRMELNLLLKQIGTANSANGFLLLTKENDEYYCSDTAVSGYSNLTYGIRKLSLTNEQFREIIESFPDTDKRMKVVQFVDVSSANQDICVVAARIYYSNRNPLYVFFSFEKDDLFSINSSEDYGFAIYDADEMISYHGLMERDTFTDILVSGKRAYIYSQEFVFSNHVYKYALVNTPKVVDYKTYAMVALVGTVMLGVTALLMFKITRKMYKPIQQTLDTTLVRGEAGEDRNNLNEFDRITENFTRMQQDLKLLEDQLQQYHVPAVSKFIHDLLKGLLPQEQLPQMYQKYHIKEIDSSYVVAIVSLKQKKVSASSLSTQSLFNTMRNQILKGIEKDSGITLFQIIDLELTEQAYIFKNTSAESLKELFQNIYNSISQTLDYNIRVAIGSMCDNLNRISVSYLNASYLISRAQQYSDKSFHILCFDNEQVYQETALMVYYPLNMEESLINAVIGGKQNIWQTLLETLIYTNQKNNFDNLPRLSLLLSATIDRILNTANLPLDVVLENHRHLNQILQACKTYDDLLKNGMDVFLSLSEQLKQEMPPDTELLKGRMLQYIHENYVQDISLLELAECLNLSQSYVSVMFKEVVGKNFKEYLSEYRLKKACELIEKKNGKVKIGDVAAEVGCNPNTLHRLFVRYKSMTPREWITSKYVSR